MYLLDTNVISELRKAQSGKANAGVVSWAQGVDVADLYLSAITLQELEQGVLRKERADPRQGVVLRTWLDTHVLPAFADRILPIDSAVAIKAASFHDPLPRPVIDTLIAATALIHGFELVTRNVADFAPMGLTPINPWT